MQYVYRCARCGTGRLATMAEHHGQGWVVDVFLCERCQYASQPGGSLGVGERETALPVGVDAAIAPVSRITGPGVEVLRMEAIFTLLGLQPARPTSSTGGRLSGPGRPTVKHPAV
jgi:hypothetical protein